MRKIKLTRANKSILLKALAPYYYRKKRIAKAHCNALFKCARRDSNPRYLASEASALSS